VPAGFVRRPRGALYSLLQSPTAPGKSAQR